MSWFLVLKSLLAICIISHFSVSSVESYACIQEKPCLSEECDPNSNTCESSQGCFSQWLELKALQTVEQKGCSDDSCTGLAFSATLGRHWVFRYDRRCCHTEHCNKELIKVPALSSEPNGVECPACFSERGICRPVLLECTGAETMCVKATGRDFIEIQAMGCATKTACHLKNMTIWNNFKIDTSCVNGSPLLSSQRLLQHHACLPAAMLPAVTVMELSSGTVSPQ
ncbi:protein RoBo-1-like [Mus pahari]|uniref:protein RoBo-1-like n=1 Tax=Mus pahari TaxID=10093 RepID=UPI000A30B2C7|nr:protein RoBo-1-like [Mus pahari]